MPDLGVVGEALHDFGRGDRLCRRGQLVGQVVVHHPHLAEVLQRQLAVEVGDPGRQVQVDDHQVFVELRSAGQQGAVRGDHHRVAVEHQLVLAADHVDVRHGRARLDGPALHQRQPHVVLVQLVGGRVDVHDQADVGPPGDRERPARLPDVLAHGERHVHPADADHPQGVAGDEVPVLVEDAVVGQVVLVVGDHDPAAVQQRERVAGAAAGLRVGAEPRRAVRVEVADRDRDVAEAAGGEVRGEAFEGVAGGRDERLAEDQILHRVAGEHHFRERHQVRARVGGAAGPLVHQCGVAREIANRRVDLGQGDA